MTKEQYKAANSKIFPVIMIILGYYLITFLLSVLTAEAHQIRKPTLYICKWSVWYRLQKVK